MIILTPASGSSADIGGLVSVDVTCVYAHLFQRGEGREKERERIDYQPPTPPHRDPSTRENLRAVALFVPVCIPRFSQGLMQNHDKPNNTTQWEAHPD